MRPEADPMGITREGGSAPGLWEALWVQPSRGFDTRLCAQRGLGGRALERSSGGSGMVVVVRVSYTAHHGTSGEDRRGGGGGGWRREASWCGGRGRVVCMHSTVVLAGGGEGDVTDAGAAAAPVPSEGRGPRQMLP